jgi:two-component system sensor kinase FixL
MKSRNYTQTLPAVALVGSVLLLGATWHMLKNGQEKFKRQKQNLEEKIHTLEEFNKELEEFTSFAAHELQEPLRKIQNYGRLVNEKQSELPPEINSYISQMIKKAESMGKLLNALLELAKAKIKTFPLSLCDLNQVLAQAQNELNDKIQSSQAEIVLAHKIPPVYANAYLMRQLFGNLISNALKFKKQGVAPRIVIHTENVNECVRILVQDNGIGIPSKYLDKIFTPFFKLDQNHENPGIGLSICKKIVEKHNGDISAISSEMLGTILIIDLPASQENVS